MRCVPLALAAACLLILLYSSVAAQPPDITVSIDKQSVSVGDPILYTLTLQYDSTLRLVVPTVGKTLGKLEVLKDSTLAEQFSGPGRKLYRRELRLAAFETGSLWIASLQGETIDARGQSTPWRSDSLLITVASVLAEAGIDTTDIRGLKEPYQAPEFRWWLWAIALLVLLGAAAVYWVRRRRHPDAPAAHTPPTPPWEAALLSLRSMPQEIDPSVDGGRLWYFRLSEILRRYFDQRYGWASIDETTTELMQRLESAPFDDGHQERAQEFFELADRVRYARHPAKVGRPEVDWEWVRQFVQSTIPVILVAPESNSTSGPPRRVPAQVVPPERPTLDVTA